MAYNKENIDNILLTTQLQISLLDYFKKEEGIIVYWLLTQLHVRIIQGYFLKILKQEIYLQRFSFN